jgi:hypothetical protein
MGTDIHAFVEIKESNYGNDWHGIDLGFSLGRCYPLFYAMAGVRAENNQPQILPKGMPKNISQSTNLSFVKMAEDAHSASWLTLKEYIKALTLSDKILSKENENYKTPDCYNAIVDIMNAFTILKFKVRLVFWFDC